MESQYLDVLRNALGGNPRECRNGPTRAIFAAQIRHDMRTGFPLLTTKRMAWKQILGELLWFIEAGRNSPEPYRLSTARLHELSSLPKGKDTIWAQDAGKPEWLKKAKFEGDCGRIYGAQWRNWNGHVDQLAKLVDRLVQDPASRYHKVTAWNPAELDQMCLPPCHGDFQCFVTFAGDGSRLLSLHMNQRSCDLFLGVPFNIASYGLLLLMLAQLTDATAYELVLTLNDAHIYEAHVDAVHEQLTRTPGTLPSVSLDPSVRSIDMFEPRHFTLTGYAPQPAIGAKLL